ncbi:MAG: MBL fold metallo-hydrolase [Rhodobiaceae bacterium]|nr:MBL fold metallo-hydrolase [Rhodobiaceae bacterium]
MPTQATDPNPAPRPQVMGFFHEPTNTISYLVVDPTTAKAVIIDPVLDFDPAAAQTSTQSADLLLAEVDKHHLDIIFILETHIHADHLSAAHYLKSKLTAPVAVGGQIPSVQKVFEPIYHFPYPFIPDGSQFDKLFKDGETFAIGALEAKVIATPGHTPACVSYAIGDALFVGDTLFMPDYGTARCDFPGGNPETLYDSIEKILSLPDETRIFLCHDYPPADRSPTWETTVAAQKSENIHIAGKTRSEFAALRRERDDQLSMPTLILPSIQLNMRAGEMPPAEDNGVSYLKIPLNRI